MHPSEFIFATHSNSLKGKTIVLAVTGSIAAVKTVELARELIRYGANVIPVLSAGGESIIHPNALEFATGNPVLSKITGKMEYLDYFGTHGKADLLLICPATGDIIGKIAYGFADELISVMAMTALGKKNPILIIPAMHETMWSNSIVQSNLEKLKKSGIHFLNPLISESAAKLPSIEEIVLECERCLLGQPLKGKRVIIASGRTEEDIDDVRVLSNRSSGKMGLELALQSYRLGAQVILVSRDASNTSGITHLLVRTANEMENALLKSCIKAHYLFMPAAIGDFDVSVKKQTGKLNSGKIQLLELTPKPKTIAKLRKRFPKLFIVGFKACAKEAELESVCSEKLKSNRLQAIVGNIAQEMLGTVQGRVWLFKGKGFVQIQGTKKEIAQGIWKEVLNN